MTKGRRRDHSNDADRQGYRAEYGDRTGKPFVYAVHAVRAEKIWATEVVWSTPEDAEDWAGKMSTDPGVLAGAVTRFRVNSPGERRAIALYVSGVRQRILHLRDDRRIAANGWVTHPNPRRRRD